MADTTPIGVEATVAGFSTFMSQMTQMTNAITQWGSQAASAVAPAINSVGAAASAAGGQIDMMAMMVAGFAIGAGMQLLDVLERAIGSLIQFGEETIEVGARVGELNSVNYLLGQRAGLAYQEVDKETASIKKMGIETSTAQNLVTQFIRNNLDLTQAAGLARVAQDAAVIGMTNSSDALDRMILGITRGQTQILNTIGINIDAETSYNAMATQLGKNVTALSETERTQALLNAVMLEGANIAGTYEAAMEEPGKRMRSLQRYIDDVQVAIGTKLKPAYGEYVDMLTGFWKAMVEAVTPAQALEVSMNNLGIAGQNGASGLAEITTESGKLVPILTFVGNIAFLVEEQLGKMAGAATTAGVSFIAELGDKLGQAAEDAFTWGANIVASLAQGMIEGAAAVLGAAMDFVGGILEYFLVSNSPPNIAPDLDKWGIGAMNSYLQGFTQADFDILKSIQSTFSGIFDVFNKLGLPITMVSEQLSMNMANMLATIEAGGIVDIAIMEGIRASTSMFGDEVYKLVDLQIQLAGVTKATTDAQKRLNDALTRISDADTKVRSLTSEYNKMLRAGASPAALKIKLAEIKAAEQQKKLATDQAKLADKEVTASQKAQKDLEDKVRLQTDLVKQLIDLAKTQADAAAKAASDAAKAAKTPKTPKAIRELPKQFKLPALKGDVIKPKVDTSALDSLREHLANIFKSFDKVKVTFDKSLNDLKVKWTWFKDIIIGTWNTIRTALSPIITPIVNLIKSIIPPDLLLNIGRVAGAIGVFLLGLIAFKVVLLAVGLIIGGIIVPILGALLSPLGLIIAAVVLLMSAWTNNWFGIRDILTNVWNNYLQPAFAAIWDWLSTNIPAAIGWVRGAWDSFKITLMVVSEFISTNILPIFKAIADFIVNVFNVNLRILTWIWDSLLLPALTIVWSFIMNSLFPLFRSLAEFISTMLNIVVTIMAGIWEKVLLPALTAVWNFIVKLLQPVLNALSAVWLEISAVLVVIGDFITKTLLDVFGKLHALIVIMHDYLKAYFLDKLESMRKLFKGIADVVEKVVDFVDSLIASLKRLVLPEWMTPGSPTPWELGLRGVIGAFKELNDVAMPKVIATLRTESVAAGNQVAANAVPRASVQAAPVAKQVSVNMGPITVNNGMDVATLRVLIRQTVRDMV